MFDLFLEYFLLTFFFPHLVFTQGDVGTSWYVIYKGSVDVIINGNSVCTLGEGDGFGELALITEKPRFIFFSR